MTSYVLEREQWLAQPLDAVFGFFGDARNLQAITPPWLGLRIRSPLPVAMREDARIEYAIRLGGGVLVRGLLARIFDYRFARVPALLSGEGV